MIPTRSCLAALYAESVIRDFLVKEARTSVPRIGFSGTEFKIGEETMTEAMILELADRFADVVQVALFTKSVEARLTGADWLWCFETPTATHSMLVQAKRPEEPMSEPAHSWTINIPKNPNEKTGKTQHQTLNDTAALLGIDPIYSLFMPGRPKSHCDMLGDDWPLDWINPFWPNWTTRSKGFIHLSRAGGWSEGSHTIQSWKPRGITLTALVCCEYSGAKSVGDVQEEGYWNMSNDNVTFEGLVSRITEIGAESGVKGAVRIRIEGRNEQ